MKDSAPQCLVLVALCGVAAILDSTDREPVCHCRSSIDRKDSGGLDLRQEGVEISK